MLIFISSIYISFIGLSTRLRTPDNLKSRHQKSKNIKHKQQSSANGQVLTFQRSQFACKTPGSCLCYRCSAPLQQPSVSPQICQCWRPAFCTSTPVSVQKQTNTSANDKSECLHAHSTWSRCSMLGHSPTYRPSKNDRPGMEVDFHDVAFGNHLDTRHLPLGQHLIDKVVPGDIPAAGVDGVQQAHDESDNEEGPQALSVHLVLLLAPLLLL